MKRLLFIILSALTLAWPAAAQPISNYVNQGSFNAPPATPPQVDAITFDNEGLFNLNLGSVGGSVLTVNNVLFAFGTATPFDFSDVLNYTNRGTMSCDTGFLFDNAPSTSGFRGMSASFGNANTGSILAGTANNVFTANLIFFLGLATFPSVEISATNVVNSGLVSVGTGGLISVEGSSLNLRRGTMHLEGFDDTNVFTGLGTTLGIFQNYEGIGFQTNQISIGSLSLPSPFSPFNNVTNNTGLPTFSFVTPPLATAFVNVLPINASNVSIEVVYINTNLSGISTDVRFAGGGGNFATPIIRWEALVTNNLGVLGNVITTNDLFLEDQFGSFATNFLVTNSFTFSGVPQIAPYNYTFLRALPFYTNFPHGNFSPFDAALLFANAAPQTNAYAAYGVTLEPLTSAPDPTLPGSTVTNSAGRIRIDASKTLDLTSAKVTGANYLRLNSTNHFVGSANAQVVSPFMDINLGTTNGLLTVSNLVAPSVTRFTGPIDMWSGRWTNTVNGFTNTFHVLIVNAQIAPTSPVSILNLGLRSTNIIVSDIINISESMLMNANGLLVTSNSPGAASAYGQINVLSQDIGWSASLPTLQEMTNFGLISLLSSGDFTGVRTPPYFPASFSEPYKSFINHGLIATSGASFWANNFENTGVGLIINKSTSTTNSLFFTNSIATSTITTTSNNSALIYSATGPVTVRAGTALMANGGLAAPAGDVTITAGTLTVSNHFLIASGALTLTVSNTLTDGGAAASNNWSVGDGINLLIKPATGDLLGTTVSNFCPAGLEVVNIWAGNDAGQSSVGFANNAALGRLILDGGDITSQFFFGGPDTSKNYAVYVDQLELRNGATNRSVVNGIQNFTTFDIADNMTVYFADAIIGSFDISEKLNGANGGRLIWVPAFAGTFSSTNLVYPPGHTNAFNRALVQSTVIDSNGNGIANAFDPSPIYTAFNVNLTVGVTNLPPRTPVIKWSGLANSTNFLYYKTNFASTNWLLVTNFVQGPANGTVRILDRGRTNATGYYKVQVNAQQP